MEMSVFLSSVLPSTSLAALRYLEIVFPAFEDDFVSPLEENYYSRVTPRALEHLAETLATVKTSLKLPMLTIRLYIPFFYPMHDADAECGVSTG